jgi:hypothetical protein
MHDSLATYLKDHLAGAGLAIDLLEAMRDRHKNEALGHFAESILAEVTEDRDSLKNLADSIGAGSNVAKELSAWVSEKFTRVKLGAAGGDFEEFEALEFLSLGIQGKLSLWNALRVCAASDSCLGSLDLSYLIVRAEEQYARVEERRLSFASAALKKPDGPRA